MPPAPIWPALATFDIGFIAFNVGIPAAPLGLSAVRLFSDPDYRHFRYLRVTVIRTFQDAASRRGWASGCHIQQRVLAPALRVSAGTVD